MWLHAVRPAPGQEGEAHDVFQVKAQTNQKGPESPQTCFSTISKPGF